MNKFLRQGSLHVVIFLALGGIFLASHEVKAGQDSFHFENHCEVHGHNDWAYCGNYWDWMQNHEGVTYNSIEMHVDLYGHRHGGSTIRTDACLMPIYDGGMTCYSYNRSGAALGEEYGGEHPQDFRGQRDLSKSGGSGGYYIFRYIQVEDAEGWLVMDGRAYYSDAPPPVCEDGDANNYGGALPCTYTPVYTVACVIRTQSEQPISGAQCSIEGQSGGTNGDGYRAFNGIHQGTHTLYVSKSGYYDYAGDYYIGGNTDLIIHMTSICAGNTGNSCNSSPNACGQTGSGTVQCNGSCSAVTPPNPAGYGNACTGPASSPNVCGQTNPGGPGTIQCNGSCNGAGGSTPPNNQCPAPSVSIYPDAGTVGYGGSTTIRWSSSNTSSCTVTPPGWTGTSGAAGTGALTSNQTYSISCNGTYWGSASNSTTVTVSAPTVTISNNQTLAWNSAPTISWTPANAASCTATNGTAGWAGAKDASAGAHSWTSAAPLTVPGTYAYSIQCFGNGSSAIATSYVTILNPVPVAYSVTYSPPDYCFSGPAGFVAWSYDDPSSSPQTAYEVKIGGYSSGKLTTSSKIFAIPNGILSFNNTYNAQVMVWNTYNQPSAWSAPTANWTTPPYAYPNVIPPYQFTWPTPPKPQQDKPVQFTDHTLFGAGGNHQWSWNFGDGGTSTQQNPAHTFTDVGNYTVTQTATDAAGQSCSYAQSVSVLKPIPVIKEVAPK